MASRDTVSGGVKPSGGTKKQKNLTMKLSVNPIRRLRHLFGSLPALAAACALTLLATGCDSVIYDYEGDCDPHHKVRFIYDHNLKFTDAFPAEVNQVTLYLLDPNTGNVVWARHDASPFVSQPGYLMDIDVAPGTYRMVAWGGDGHRSHFSIDESALSVPGLDNPLRCHLVAKDDTPYDDDLHHTSHPLDGLYHGMVTVEEFTDRQGTHIHEVKMMKNTNDFHIVLQHINGKQVKPDDFRISIEAGNGHLEHDNTPVKDAGRISYHPWFTAEISAGVEKPDGSIEFGDSRGIINAAAALADLRTSRLMLGDNQMLKIYRKDGGKVFEMPLTDFCLAMKGKHREMDNQEYLDRQDDYNMVFFVDDDHEWVDTYIYINSWRVILQNEEL